MQEHLDWHFRRNRRAKERLQKIRPRGWFVSLEAWEGAKEIEDVEMSEAALFGLEGSADSKKKSYNPYDDDDETEDIDKQLGLDEYSNGRVAAGNGDDLNSGGGGGEADGGEGSTGGDSRQAIRNKNIVVVNPDFQSKKCPICREKFDMFWSDEDEEWMCRNARFLNNELHHATCYIDMMKKKQAIEAAAAANVNTSVELKVKTAMKRKSSSGLNPADNTNGNGNHESKNQSQSSNLVATNPDEPNPKRQALESTS
ncbi:mRNA 3' end processing factor [Mycoemilia scoparia]|uniref:mRNA 3' end processing factor n=1 Tax=Mycoemilia scoparia TaxID=417184 RepID=A0A9W8DNP1_9FUNG|nr:mRNA 3' end processing factor [Mycoemilia scoparia]